MACGSELRAGPVGGGRGAYVPFRGPVGGAASSRRRYSSCSRGGDGSRMTSSRYEFRGCEPGGGNGDLSRVLGGERARYGERGAGLAS